MLDTIKKLEVLIEKNKQVAEKTTHLYPARWIKQKDENLEQYTVSKIEFTYDNKEYHFSLNVKGSKKWAYVKRVYYCTNKTITITQAKKIYKKLCKEYNVIPTV